MIRRFLDSSLSWRFICLALRLLGLLFPRFVAFLVRRVFGSSLSQFVAFSIRHLLIFSLPRFVASSARFVFVSSLPMFVNSMVYLALGWPLSLLGVLDSSFTMFSAFLLRCILDPWLTLLASFFIRRHVLFRFIGLSPLWLLCFLDRFFLSSSGPSFLASFVASLVCCFLGKFLSLFSAFSTRHFFGSTLPHYVASSVGRVPNSSRSLLVASLARGFLCSSVLGLSSPCGDNSLVRHIFGSSHP